MTKRVVVGEIVGVRELKAHLSAYVRVATAGRTVVIGDRKRQPIAQLAPLSRSADDERLERLERAGVIRRGRGRPATLPGVKKRTRRSVAAMALEDRR